MSDTMPDKIETYANPVTVESPNGGSPSGEEGRVAAPRRRLVVAGVAVLAVVVVGAAVAVVTGRSKTTVVVASAAAPTTIQSLPGGNGNLSATAGGSTLISLNLAGVSAPVAVTQVFVDDGSVVKAGDPLVALDPTPIQARAQQLSLTLSQDQAALLAAQQAEAAATTPAARASFKIGAQTLQGQVALDQQMVSVANGLTASIVAPVAGVVSSVSVRPGAAVSPGKGLLNIVDLSKVVIDTAVSLSDLQTVHAGQTAVVTFPTLPGVTLQGHVTGVSPEATAHGLNGTVEVEATNLATNPVPLGVQSLVSINAPQQAAVSVPRLAVFNMDFDPAVYVIDHGRVHRQPVTVGASDLNRVQILSGLSVGQQVALTNAQSLQDGGAVRVSGTQS